MLIIKGEDVWVYRAIRVGLSGWANNIFRRSQEKSLLKYKNALSKIPEQ